MNTCPKCGERAEAIGRSGSDVYRCITCGHAFEETPAEALARTATVTSIEKMPHCEKPCRYCGHVYERGCAGHDIGGAGEGPLSRCPECHCPADEPLNGSSTVDYVAAAIALGERFSGISVEYRRHGETNWPLPVRVRLVTAKRARQEYAEPVYGKSVPEACKALVSRVAKLDEGRIPVCPHCNLRWATPEHLCSASARCATRKSSS